MIGGTKKYERIRTIEVIDNILKEQPLHMLFYFLYDSQQNRDDLFEIALAYFKNTSIAVLKLSIIVLAYYFFQFSIF